MKNPNSAKGRTSYDSVTTGEMIPFFNRNVTPYPTESGSVNFDLVPVEKQKDIMLNVARMHAQQEYDRIMELVSVLSRQALGIKRRLEITDMVHSTKYQFKPTFGKTYWLAFDTRKQEHILCQNGPDGWSSGHPEDYKYIVAIKMLGDHTWIEVD